jgi:hypothetical protein
VDGVTGVLFGEQTVEEVVRGVIELEQSRIDAMRCRRNAERFDRSVFRRGMEELLDRHMQAPSRSELPAVDRLKVGSG